MSNIERRYAYLDEGVFPEEGEYGVTYLTLYSSNAGNIYDGWVYDPYNRVRESFTERTYGYRNPDYPQYCWDDEVVVDLSNAQSRQESSEYIQGRITSFNTNVSDRPIILQDIDITGLTEEERENLATTVLFSAIPLVQDAYIQANVEVQCKCNLSPDNTSGEMRIEAFYILNDESDRTMRPNPVHTFTVSSANERHTLPWLYWNPALRHEDHNYIGVKLICTGGTAEIGISDNPDYGDAMITLASAGLTGDHIDSGNPVYLEIFGKEEVVGGYELDINDYTVLCTYDTGEIYDVTRLCSFNPAMGTPITEALTTLTATYMGLHASMTIRLGMVESIELMGADIFYGSIRLELKDYTVLAYMDNGDIMDVTAECTFSPAMGTTINADTTLTATYSPYWMQGAEFTDSMEIEKQSLVAYGSNYDTEDHLVYSLYSDNHIIITGNATHLDQSGENVINEHVTVPGSLESYIYDNGYTLEWAAEGKISGYKSIASATINNDQLSNWKGLCHSMRGFDDVEITSHMENGGILLDFQFERDLTSSMLKWLRNVDNSPIRSSRGSSDSVNGMFIGCEALTNVDFASAFNISGAIDTSYMCAYCLSLKNIDGFKYLDMSSVRDAEAMFLKCTQLETISASSNWNLLRLEDASRMFDGDISLSNIDAFWFWRPDRLSNLTAMLRGIGADHVSGLKNWDKSSWRSIGAMVDGSKIVDLDGLQDIDFSNMGYDTIYFGASGCPELISLDGCEDWVLSPNCQIQFKNNPKLVDISAVSNWDFTSLRICDEMFAYDESLEDLTPLTNIDFSSIRTARGMFAADSALSNLQPLSSWRTSSLENANGMFAGDDKVRYIGCLSGWDMSNIDYAGGGILGMFARTIDDRDNDFANTHIIDAGSLHWNVPNYTSGHRSDANDTAVGVTFDAWNRYYTSSSGAFLYGTDYPAAKYRHEKYYSLPDWYGGPYED